MQLRKIEHPTRQKLLKRRRHILKARQVRPLLPHPRLRLVPNILNRVLARVVRRKPKTRDRPVLLRPVGVHLRKIVAYRACFVVTGIVPDDGQLRMGKAPLQVAQKVRRRQRIGSVIRHIMGHTADHIHRTIIRLAHPHVADWYIDALVAWAPNISTRIAPTHEAFIDKEYYPLAPRNLLLMGVYIRFYFIPTLGDQDIVFLGFVAWDFFQLSPASCRRS